jgi:hypothetical protein
LKALYNRKYSQINQMSDVKGILSEIHDVQLVEDSLLYALEVRKIDKKLIIHSDRGMPYRSNRWMELTADGTLFLQTEYV